MVSRGRPTVMPQPSGRWNGIATSVGRHKTYIHCSGVANSLFFADIHYMLVAQL